MLKASDAPQRWHSPRQNPPATTHSRSSSRAGSCCAPWQLPRRERPSVSLLYRLPHSRPSLEDRMTSEMRLNQAPPHLRHGSNIGQPLTRRDGILKVTGKARYAADHHPPGMLFAVLAVSSIARGRVASLDVQAVKDHAGVVVAMQRVDERRVGEVSDV